MTEIASNEPTRQDGAPRGPRRAKGSPLRCRDLAIGYPEQQIASDVQLEIDHGSRAAVVGDNGQENDVPGAHRGRLRSRRWPGFSRGHGC